MNKWEVSFTPRLDQNAPSVLWKNSHQHGLFHKGALGAYKGVMPEGSKWNNFECFKICSVVDKILVLSLPIVDWQWIQFCRDS